MNLSLWNMYDLENNQIFKNEPSQNDLNLRFIVLKGTVAKLITTEIRKVTDYN